MEDDAGEAVGDTLVKGFPYVKDSTLSLSKRLSYGITLRNTFLKMPSLTTPSTLNFVFGSNMTSGNIFFKGDL